MFISEAFAQAPGAAGADPNQFLIGTLLPIGLMIVVMYFFIIRPRQNEMKKHTEMLNTLKRGDVVVTGGGLIGKVKSTADDEIRLELAPNVEVRVVRSAIAQVRSKTDPAPANDSKPAAAS